MGAKQQDEHSGTRAAILDAAFEIMRAEGYAAVTSRKIAEKAGLKSKLIHYYFRTMDDLFLAVFRRLKEEVFERQAKALATSNPFRALWEVHANMPAATVGMELIALANHRKFLREEIARESDRSRKLHSEMFKTALKETGTDTSRLPPIVLALLMVAISRLLANDNILGVTAGHSEISAFIERTLRWLETEHQPRGSRRQRPAPKKPQRDKIRLQKKTPSPVRRKAKVPQ